jgi:hypothetical protein
LTGSPLEPYYEEAGLPKKWFQFWG